MTVSGVLFWGDLTVLLPSNGNNKTNRRLSIAEAAHEKTHKVI
jgi:hypothetical protein